MIHIPPAKIAFVSGFDPSRDRDGVGHYTERLYESLLKDSDPALDIRMIHFRPNSSLEWLVQLPAIFKGHDLVHLQYPTESWGASIMPGIYPALLNLLPLFNKRLLVTFHEWASMHPLRAASVAPLAFLTDAAVFVSEVELRAFKNSRYFSLRANREPFLESIPIGVNVVVPDVNGDAIGEMRRRLLNAGGYQTDMLLGFFGFIYASKQPSKLLQTIRELHDRGVKARLVITGDFPLDHVAQKSRFFDEVRALKLEHYILFRGYTEDSMELATTLKACNAILLPFAEGVSARRGSFWYVLELGVPLITTTPESAVEFDGLLDTLDSELQRGVRFLAPTAGAEEFGETAIEFRRYESFPCRPGLAPSWKKIGLRHQSLYKRLLGLECLSGSDDGRREGKSRIGR